MSKTKDEAIAHLNAVYDTLIDKPKLVLEVTVDSREQAEELINWLFSKDVSRRSVVAELHAIHWDSVAIRQADYDKYLKVIDLMKGE